MNIIARPTVTSVGKSPKVNNSFKRYTPSIYKTRMPAAKTLESSNSSMGRFDRFSDNHPAPARKDSRRQLQVGNNHIVKKTSQQQQPHRGQAKSATSNGTDRPLLLPIRQMSHSVLSCVTENSNSDLSTSARFAIAEHDQAVPAPRRQISKGFSDRFLLELSSRSGSNSDLSATTKLSSELDQSYTPQISQSLSSLLEEET